MPKAGHRIIRPRRSVVFAFCFFLSGFRHEDQFRLSLLHPPGSPQLNDELLRRIKLQLEVLRFLTRRLSRGFGKKGVQLGDGSKAIKLEFPVHLLEYVATFESRYMGFLGKRWVDQMAGASDHARAFVAICCGAAMKRRGRPFVTQAQIERRELSVLSERQQMRLMKRDANYRAAMASPRGLFGLLIETD